MEMGAGMVVILYNLKDNHVKFAFFFVYALNRVDVNNYLKSNLDQRTLSFVMEMEVEMEMEKEMVMVMEMVMVT